VNWDASRSDDRDKQHGLAGTDARAGFKDGAELIFAIAALLPSRIVLELPKLFLGGHSEPTRRSPTARDEFALTHRRRGIDSNFQFRAI
jgi:hypothetical protein